MRPNYDVNLDPVVRTTAAEVRKRLIQYYYSPDHAGELIIELPVGSYVPLFQKCFATHTAVQINTQLVYESPEGIPSRSGRAGSSPSRFP